LGIGAAAVVSRAFERGRGDRKFVFSAMQPADLPGVVAVEQAAFRHPWSAEVFERELGLPFSRIVVARASEDLVGYVCHWIGGEALELQNVAVHPEWRRRSIGRRLVSIALDDGRRAGASRALLEVRRYNYGAIALYRELGFRETGFRPQYYDDGEDAILMELVLAR
jgi:ribosomal-protein-alanine N-acetyltransferase